MIKKIKIVHFTHNDSDAVGCDVMLKLDAYLISRDPHFYCDVDTYFMSVGEVNSTIEKFIDNLTVDSYDEYGFVSIQLTDIGPSDYVLDRLVLAINDLNVALNCHDESDAKYAFHGIDHHITNVAYKNPIYSNWFYVNDKTALAPDLIKRDNKTVKISATYILFNMRKDPYEYALSDHQYNSVKRMATDISNYDTWEWKKDVSSTSIDDYHNENITQTLVRMFGPKFVSDMIFSHIISESKHNEDIKGYRCSCGICNNRPKESKKLCPACHTKICIPEINPVTSYIDSKYITVYESECISKFNSVKASLKKDKIYNCKFTDIVDGLGNNIDCANFVIHVCGSNDDINEISTFMYDYLLKDELRHGFVLILFPSSLSISFRSSDMDVSLLAKEFGGGGHRNAAGAKVLPSVMLDFLKFYYQDDIGSYVLNYVGKQRAEISLHEYIKTLPILDTFKYDHIL